MSAAHRGPQPGDRDWEKADPERGSKASSSPLSLSEPTGFSRRPYWAFAASHQIFTDGATTLNESLTTQKAISEEQIPTLPRQIAGLLVGDIAHRRLLEGILGSLDLDVYSLEDANRTAERLHDFEMIVADEAVARELRPMVKLQQMSGEQIRPALVAIVGASYAAISHRIDRDAFDAVLNLPAQPALLAAQLGVALYAHRAFAQRYQSALEELNLNRNIFKSVTSGISVANAQLPDLPLMYVNPAFEAMTGYTLEEIVGKNCRFLQKDERDQPGLTLIREAIAHQRETTAVLKNFRKDGTAFWNELALSPIRNHAGQVTHIVGIQMDVTQRVEFEMALREAEKLAAVGRLASAISHEINNPLEAITNLVFLSLECCKVEDHEKCHAYLLTADEELKRIKLITAQSLRFSKQSHKPEAVTCEDLLGSILDIFESRFKNFDITVETRYRFAEHLVCLVSEIRQVLSNLIANAIDAMRQKGGNLLVRTHEASHAKTGKKGVIITIADTGTGMSKETKANMFKAFYTTKGVNGTGLGLWISGDIVQRHHGYLSVRSSQQEPLRGTVFQLFLPFQAASGESGQQS